MRLTRLVGSNGGKQPSAKAPLGNEPNSGERVSAACQRALQINGVSYTSVNSILKTDLGRVPLVIEVPAKVVSTQHANLRRLASYQQALALVEA